MATCIAFCSLWVLWQELQSRFSAPGKEPSSLNHRGQWKHRQSIVHDTQWGRKWLYLWGSGPVIRGSMSEVFSFVIVGRSPIKLSSAPPIARGLKKKKNVAQQVEHDRRLTHTPFCQVLGSHTGSSSPFCWCCVFSFLSLVFLDRTEKPGLVSCQLHREGLNWK